MLSEENKVLLIPKSLNIDNKYKSYIKIGDNLIVFASIASKKFSWFNNRKFIKLILGFDVINL